MNFDITLVMLLNK